MHISLSVTVESDEDPVEVAEVLEDVLMSANLANHPCVPIKIKLGAVEVAFVEEKIQEQPHRAV